MKWLVGCSYATVSPRYASFIPAVEVDLGYYLRYYVTCANANNIYTTIIWYRRATDAGNNMDMPLDWYLMRDFHQNWYCKKIRGFVYEAAVGGVVGEVQPTTRLYIADRMHTGVGVSILHWLIGHRHHNALNSIWYYFFQPLICK